VPHVLAVTNEHPTPGGPRFAGWRRYALALAVAAVGVFVTQLFAGEMFTTPLVGMVVLVGIFLGIGPAHAAIAVAWVGLALIEDPQWSLAIEENAVARRWAISLVVALVLVWIGWSLQRRRRRETERAIEAERESATSKDLQELATSLSAAATPSEVARSLVTLMPDLLGAIGGSLGLIEGDEIVIVDPGAAVRAALRPGLRLPLTTRSPVATAARTGKPAYANTPREFRRVFP
jgi:K+-sensing histidine kinase KdpD